MQLASVKPLLQKLNDSGYPHLKHVLDCHTVLATAAGHHPKDIHILRACSTVGAEH